MVSRALVDSHTLPSLNRAILSDCVRGVGVTVGEIGVLTEGVAEYKGRLVAFEDGVGLAGEAASVSLAVDKDAEYDDEGVSFTLEDGVATKDGEDLRLTAGDGDTAQDNLKTRVRVSKSRSAVSHRSGKWCDKVCNIFDAGPRQSPYLGGWGLHVLWI